MDKTLKMSLLFDFYGPLLTQRQQTIYQLYFDDDLSLGEIADQLKISRQAVFDVLKRSGLSLEAFEKKLQLVAKHQIQQALLNEAYEQFVQLRDLLNDNDFVNPGFLEEIQNKIRHILSDS